MTANSIPEAHDTTSTNASNRQYEAAATIERLCGDGVVAYHVAFAHIFKSVTAALFLSQLLYWRRHSSDGVVFRTQEQLTQETGLSRYEQEHARRVLTHAQVLRVERKGTPARLYYTVDLERLAALLAMEDSDRRTLDCETATNKIASFQQSRLRKNHNLDRDFPAINIENNTENNIETNKEIPPLGSALRSEPFPPGGGSTRAATRPANGKSRFVKPTPEQALEYGLSIGMKRDEVAAAYDHYEANGWKVGRTPMKDWRAAFRNWHRREQQRPANTSNMTMRELAQYYEQRMRNIGLYDEEGNPI